MTRSLANLAPVERRSALRHAFAMDPLPPPPTFFLLLFSGWIDRHQQAVIDYLLEENRVLRAVNGSRRLRLTDDQRRRLAVKGHVLGRRHLAAFAGIVTPDTILRWYPAAADSRARAFSLLSASASSSTPTSGLASPAPPPRR